MNPIPTEFISPTSDQDDMERLARMVCHLPSQQRDEFIAIFHRVLDEHRARSLNSLVTLRQLRRVARRNGEQRDAYARFILALLETGSKHDPEFFKPHFETFCRLRDEYNDPTPSEHEVRAEILRNLEQCAA